MTYQEDFTAISNAGGTAVDSEGARIGIIGRLYAAEATSDPSWITVKTGLFGISESFVPLEGARAEGSDIVVPYTKAEVKDAPRLSPGGEVDDVQLYGYYELRRAGTSRRPGKRT